MLCLARKVSNYECHLCCFHGEGPGLQEELKHNVSFRFSIIEFWRSDACYGYGYDVKDLKAALEQEGPAKPQE